MQVLRTVSGSMSRYSVWQVRIRQRERAMHPLAQAEGLSGPFPVSELLGHSTISIMLDTHSHVLPTMQRDAAATLERLFGS